MPAMGGSLSPLPLIGTDLSQDRRRMGRGTRKREDSPAWAGGINPPPQPVSLASLAQAAQGGGGPGMRLGNVVELRSQPARSNPNTRLGSLSLPERSGGVHEIFVKGDVPPASTNNTIQCQPNELRTAHR